MNTVSISGKAGDSATIEVSPPDGVTFSVADPFYASVSTEGKVTLNKVGETTINVSSRHGRASVPVTVIPRYNLFPDYAPLIGRPEDEFRAGAIVPTISYADDGYVKVYKDFDVCASAVSVYIKFGKIANIAVLTPLKYSAELGHHLGERYDVMGQYNGVNVLWNKDATVSITVQTSYPYFLTLFSAR